MSLLQFLATGAPPPATNIEDVFSAYTYAGSASTQTITNGIDLAGMGGLVWIKNRSTATDSNVLFDSGRGNYYLATDQTWANNATSALTRLSSGFSITGGASYWNTAGNNFVSWTFRKAAKFFDVVTYTGNGTTQAISHSLGVAPGMVVIKRTDAVADWYVWHQGTTSGYYLNLNSTAAQSNSGATTAFGNNTITVDPTSSVFTVGNSSAFNASSATYVAYLFAHDTSATGLIQAGSFTTDASGNATVTLGWEPQYLVRKASSVGEGWTILDSMRGMYVEGTSGDAYLYPHLTNAEGIAGATSVPITSTGFKSIGLSANTTYIYLAIRRGPMAQPTAGSQVYAAETYTGNATARTLTGAGFPLDLVITHARGSAGYDPQEHDRLRGKYLWLRTNSTSAEYSQTDGLTDFGMTGISLGTDASIGNLNSNTITYVNWYFRRYPGVFDEVCYTGTGSATTVAHNLTVVPELIIVKQRSLARGWATYSATLGNTKFLLLHTTDAEQTNTYWNNTTPTASVFSIDGSTIVNDNTPPATYVAYLFATVAGISKVGSYTGNGTSQTINAGFSAGARFVLIKRTDAVGDWFVWDSTRGIVAANDPHLSLNTAVAEVTTDDTIDPDNSGFIANQLAATNINVSSATYIYLAFA